MTPKTQVQPFLSIRRNKKQPENGVLTQEKMKKIGGRLSAPGAHEYPRPRLRTSPGPSLATAPRHVCPNSKPVTETNSKLCSQKDVALFGVSEQRKAQPETKTKNRKKIQPTRRRIK